MWRPFACQNTIPGAELLKLQRSIFLPMIRWSFSFIFVVSSLDFWSWCRSWLLSLAVSSSSIVSSPLNSLESSESGWPFTFSSKVL